MLCRLVNNTRFFFATVLGSVFCLTASSQTPKGLITENKQVVAAGKTRALVIGISKYQYIDSLEYADRDAQMFADYLRQAHFWGIHKDDVTLLINDKAKNGDVITQLARIAQVSQPGDNLIFYFSGHGDVETITQFNNGYLLAYDTYSNNYIAGALPISFLKELFVTLINKNIRIIVVTDACRSGKLAGGMKGSEFVAAAISNMWNTEIKILSTQPGRLSYEGTEWGNGRGVFSWYLIKGLNGEADANNDSLITIAELDMYVG
ncbi:MAG: caspase family protein, partial [Chitinophagaceae bacterium]